MIIFCRSHYCVNDFLLLLLLNISWQKTHRCLKELASRVLDIKTNSIIKKQTKNCL